jgi:hypothetical protein
MGDVAGGLVAFFVGLIAIGLLISGVVWVITHFWVLILLLLVAAAVAGVVAYVLKERYKVWREAEAVKRDVYAVARAEKNAHERIGALHEQVRDEMIQAAERYDGK